jgi:hypothetical protein
MKLHTITALSLLLLAGCNEVEERLSWSPDGSRAILRVDGKLYFLDPDGNLSGVIASSVTGAAWLPDRRGLVLTRSLTVDKWQDAERLLPADEVASVQSLAKSFLALGAEGTEQFEPKRPELVSAAILYLFDSHSNALHEALQKSKDPEKLEADLSNLRTTQVAEVSVVAPDGQTLRVIERSLAGYDQPRPSPKAPAVAFTRDETLIVAPLDGSTNRVTAAEKLTGGFDWTADGQSLVYAARLSEKDASDIIARVERRTVMDAAGAWVAGEPTPLTMIYTTFRPRVAGLADGRVLLASLALQLPAPAAAEQIARLYWIDPAVGTNAAPVAIPSAAGALPQDLASFAPSPDGRQIAVVESGSDSVVVLDVTSGAAEIVSPKRGWKSRILPAWRGSSELYFAALTEDSSARPALFRWRRGSAPVAISTNWPDEIVSSLLRKPEK